VLHIAARGRHSLQRRWDVRSEEEDADAGMSPLVRGSASPGSPAAHLITAVSGRQIRDDSKRIPGHVPSLAHVDPDLVWSKLSTNSDENSDERRD